MKRDAAREASRRPRADPLHLPQGADVTTRAPGPGPEDAVSGAGPLVVLLHRAGWPDRYQAVTLAVTAAALGEPVSRLARVGARASGPSEVR